jgi:SNF2 family DNA or RNA helicase
VSTLSNWQKEFRQWPPQELRDMLKVKNMQNVDTKGDSATTFQARLNYIKKWNREGGVLLMGYEAFRLLAGKPQKPDFLEHLPKPPKGQSWPPEVIDNLKPAQKEALSKWRQQTNQWKKIAPYLLDPGPDVVIADEGHKIKNKDTGLTKLVNKFQTLYRVALTGSPLQNNLEEYRVMINWVRKGLLGEANKFHLNYVVPIMAGQMKDSDAQDKRIMRIKTAALYRRTEGVCVDRKNLSMIAEQLPSKREFVVCLNISPFQRMLYIHFLTLLCNQMVDEMGVSAKKTFLIRSAPVSVEDLQPSRRGSDPNQEGRRSTEEAETQCQ